MLSSHDDERSEKGDQQARVYETGDGDNLARWIFLNRWNGGGFTGDGGLVESEEDGMEEGRRLLVGIGLEIRMDIDNESGADGREQTRL